MATKNKLTKEGQEHLVAKYAEFISSDGMKDQDYNKRFFVLARKTEEFQLLTDNQIRAILVSRKVYKATSPRQEAKKGGKRKEDFISELSKLIQEKADGYEATSLTKMTIADLEILIHVIKGDAD